MTCSWKLMTGVGYKAELAARVVCARSLGCAPLQSNPPNSHKKHGAIVLILTSISSLCSLFCSYMIHTQVRRRVRPWKSGHFTHQSFACLTEVELEVLIKSTTGSVLVQTRDPEDATIERCCQFGKVTVLTTSLKRGELRLLVKTSNRDVAQCRSTVERALRREGEAVVAVRELHLCQLVCGLWR